MQADRVLEESRALDAEGSRRLNTEQSLNTENLKTLYSDPPLQKALYSDPPLLIVPLFKGQSFKHMTIRV